MAAKSAKVNLSTYSIKFKKNRKGIHSKKKNSKLKTSKNYNKPYRGQGR